MKQTCEQKTNWLIRLLRGESGFSVLVIIFVMMVLTVIGYSMTRMMATKQKSVPVTAQSSSAFYVAEGGINYGGKYLSDLVSWSSLSDESKNLGNGNFNVVFSDYCAYGSCASTGTSGDATRVLASRYCREQGYGCMP